MSCNPHDDSIPFTHNAWHQLGAVLNVKENKGTYIPEASEMKTDK